MNVTLITNVHSHIPPLHIYHGYIKGRTARVCASDNHTEVLHRVPGGVRGTVITQTPVIPCIIQHMMEGMQIQIDKHGTIHTDSTNLNTNVPINTHSLFSIKRCKMNKHLVV